MECYNSRGYKDYIPLSLVKDDIKKRIRYCQIKTENYKVLLKLLKEVSQEAKKINESSDPEKTRLELEKKEENELKKLKDALDQEMKENKKLRLQNEKLLNETYKTNDLINRQRRKNLLIAIHLGDKDHKIFKYPREALLYVPPTESGMKSKKKIRTLYKKQEVSTNIYKNQKNH
ncbi:unnamed protein product [Moneuplotes crassus]|uniref:Uncharacterized protein n=1 Tax=Euplotes crassus TaxID=5936 RepID=A0AAD1U2S3_EUPCR|nr:unnamed protein product [Moneuplotes crassus]